MSAKRETRGRKKEIYFSFPLVSSLCRAKYRVRLAHKAPVMQAKINASASLLAEVSFLSRSLD